MNNGPYKVIEEREINGETVIKERTFASFGDAYKTVNWLVEGPTKNTLVRVHAYDADGKWVNGAEMSLPLGPLGVE